MRDFEMPVSSVFSVRGRGMVLAGTVRRGSVGLGDRLTVTSPRAAKSAVVAGIERVGTRELLDAAHETDEVAILCRELEIDDVRDGLERVDERTWKVLDLTVRSREHLAARFWRRIRELAGKGVAE